MEENERLKEKQEEEEEIWSWGAGTEGQLGTGKLSDEHCPHLLNSLSSFAPISLLACGGAHVIALVSGLFPSIYIDFTHHLHVFLSPFTVFLLTQNSIF